MNGTNVQSLKSRPLQCPGGLVLKIWAFGILPSFMIIVLAFLAISLAFLAILHLAILHSLILLLCTPSTQLLTADLCHLPPPTTDEACLAWPFTRLSSWPSPSHPRPQGEGFTGPLAALRRASWTHFVSRMEKMVNLGQWSTGCLEYPLVPTPVLAALTLQCNQQPLLSSLTPSNSHLHLTVLVLDQSSHLFGHWPVCEPPQLPASFSVIFACWKLPGRHEVIFA